MTEQTAAWASLELASELRDKLAEQGIGAPTAVQAAAVPALLAGRNVSARSQTGSGKTLAFVLPILQRIDAARPIVQAVVIAPTQELAVQILHVAETYAEPLGVRVQSAIGGASVKRQVERLRDKPQLVVGTPGRAHELMQMRKLRLHETAFVVVDEADQVFDLGSSRELEALLKAMPRSRQIAFFSATYPPGMAEVEARWMNDPVRIDIAPEHRVAASIRHFYLVCERRDKTDTARRLLRLLEPSSALLFLNDTDNVANWESKLGFEGFTVETLYGDADKIKRARTLARFRGGQSQLLLATDVAARGLDIEGLPLVLNLDPPEDADHYVHRAGRTGRMGREGVVATLVTPQERFVMDKFAKRLGIELPELVMSRGRLVEPGEAKRRPEGGGARSAKAGNGRGGSAEAPGAGAAERAGRPAAVRAGDGYGEGGRSPETEGAAGRPSARLGGAEPGRREAGQAGTAAPRSGARKASAGTAAPKAAGPSKAERERQRKNKGAPKWLKAKREGGDGAQ